MRPSIYFDNSSFGAPSPGAINAMLPFFTESWGDPTAPYDRGQRLQAPIKAAVESLCRLLGASLEDEIILTSSGAEAVNHVVASTYHDVTRMTGRNHYLVGATDEAPAIMATLRLQERGCLVTLVPGASDGTIPVNSIAESLSPRTALLTLSWGNGLTGVLNSVQEIGALCDERGVVFHLDVTQVIGKMPCDISDTGADFITFNGTGLHGPVGTGVLLLRKRRKLSPFIVGGKECGAFRGGDINVPGLIGLGVAAEEAWGVRESVSIEIARLRGALEEGILASVPGSLVFFPESRRLPHCTAIRFPGCVSEALLFHLNRHGVAACMGGGSLQQIGYNLRACGVEAVASHEALSFSLSRYNTFEEVDKAVMIVAGAAAHLKKVQGA